MWRQSEFLASLWRSQQLQRLQRAETGTTGMGIRLTSFLMTSSPDIGAEDGTEHSFFARGPAYSSRVLLAPPTIPVSHTHHVSVPLSS